MGRRAAFWQRAGRTGWYATIAGRQVKLADSRPDAEREFYRLKMDGGSGGGPTFGDVVNRFLPWLRTNRKPSTADQYRKLLEAMAGGLNHLAASSLAVEDVEAAYRPAWGSTTRRGAAVVVVCALNRAVKMRMILKNPLAGKLELPTKKSRGREAIVSPSDFAVILEHSNDRLRDALIAIRQTGCRPGELVGLNAENVDLAAGVWVLPEHKTDADGMPRVIHLSDTAKELTRRLVEANPTGTVFRNNRNHAWTVIGLNNAMAMVRERIEAKGLAIKTRGVLYGLRHTFATDLLRAKVPDTHVAALLGHRSTAILHRHYSHLSGAGEVLKPHLALLT